MELSGVSGIELKFWNLIVELELLGHTFAGGYPSYKNDIFSEEHCLLRLNINMWPSGRNDMNTRKMYKGFNSYSHACGPILVY